MMTKLSRELYARLQVQIFWCIPDSTALVRPQLFSGVHPPWPKALWRALRQRVAARLVHFGSVPQPQ